mgnify:CR=1 FL=1
MDRHTRNRARPVGGCERPRERDAARRAQPLYRIPPRRARSVHAVSARAAGAARRQRSHAHRTRTASRLWRRRCGSPGRILDEETDARFARTLVEVWNANAHRTLLARYRRRPQRTRRSIPTSTASARLLTDDEGQLAVRTIKPGAHIARRDISWWRPPHVHFSILGSGIRLVTQMYFPDEPLNEKDFIFLIVPEDHRARVDRHADGVNRRGSPIRIRCRDSRAVSRRRRTTIES